jgi:hypothetical protein
MVVPELQELDLPDLPEHDLPITEFQIDPDLLYVVTDPWLGTWWEFKSVTGVSEQTMGWLVAQGWEITDVFSDATTTPPTLTYALEKQQLVPEAVLRELCASWTLAAQNAYDANAFRYNRIVADWSQMITETQTHFDSQISEHNTATGEYLENLSTYMDTINDLVAANRAAFVADAGDATTAAGAMDTKLDDLETNADANATIISGTDGLLEDQAGYLDTFLALVGGDDTGLLAELESDYTDHKNLTSGPTGFLEGLGASELDRINEQFAAKLSEQLQQLTDRGLYSSGVVTDITQRNHRDKDEQIQILNDRLMREKLENQHKLYGQLFGVRNRILEGEDRLHSLQQEISRVEMAERDVLLGQLQDAVKGKATGKERLAALTIQAGSMLAENEHRAIGQEMTEYTTRLDSVRSINAENMRIMEYQLKERNELIVGLYSFVERREDIGPEWKDMVSMIAGLGDAAGGWIQP